MTGRTKGFAYRYRHVRRYQEILNILAKNGFGFIIDRLELPGQSLYQRFKKEKPPQAEELANLPERITQVMKELGPTFIKLGQLFSTRPDLLSADYIKEFAKLQDEVTPVPIEMIKSVISEETGGQIDELFAEFELDALASASIGQVHRAKLVTGEDVVVKIQRPGIERLIKTDLEILEDIARFLEERTPLVENYNITDMLVEFRISILEELDFSLEGRNAEIFKANLQDDSRVYIPRIYWEYTKKRVLVMEYVEGAKIGGREKMIASGYDPRQIAEALVEAMITQIYTDGFFHSDPHPGNLAVLPGNKIVFMDFGQVGYLDEEIREKAADMVLALLKHDIDAVVKGLLQIGIVCGQPNMSHLRRDVSRLERKYYGMSLQEVEVGTSVQELMEVASRYNIRIPTDFVMAAKAGVTLEGTIRDLVPDLSLVEIGKPFATKVYLHRYDPRKILHKTQKNSLRLFSTLMHLPELFEDLIDNIRSGRLALSIELKDLPMAVNQLKSAANRLAVSIIFSGLLIAGALMVRINPSSFIIRYHISEVIFVFAFLVVGLLLFTLFFDHRN